jgi:hypothetical protein
MRYVDNPAKRKRFYEALIELPWLAPEVRVAVMRTLHRSQRYAEVQYRKGATAVYKLEVDETAARMRANGERPPRGDKVRTPRASISSLNRDGAPLTLRSKSTPSPRPGKCKFERLTRSLASRQSSSATAAMARGHAQWGTAVHRRDFF